MAAAGGARTATATILFTDVVGSTELRTVLGDARADRVLADHEVTLRRIVESAGGRVIKGLGDGVMAAFEAAADAVAAAIGVQRAVERANRLGIAPARLEVRAGISAGDVAITDDDCHGTPVVEASRLCAEAESGHILCSEIVRLLTRGRGEHQYRSLGTIELKGLPDGVDTCEVAWEPDRAPAMLPAVLTGTGPFAFVGRDAELDMLRQAWKRAQSGDRVLFMVTGEQGTGKTRLCSELARLSQLDGGIVLAGRCDEEPDVPYQPFVEALRHFAAHATHHDLRAGLGGDGGELVRLVPELATRIRGLPAPPRAEPETERFRLMDAVAGWLTAASATQPVLLVLDDLHWAAKPTLLMLRHVVRSSPAMRLLIVAPYRDTEVGSATAGLIADLRREGAERVALTGLDAAGVLALLEAAAGHDLRGAGELADTLYAETRGNPLFIGEILLHLAESGAIYHEDGRWRSSLRIDQLPIPESLRDVIARRVARLSEGASSLLAVAAVAGSEFDVKVVAAAAGVSEDVAIARAEETLRVGLVEETGVWRYRFAHTVVREVLYRSLSATRRASAHRSIGEALERAHAGDIDEVIGELARHFAVAVTTPDVDKAVRYAHLAGDRALAQHAPDDAMDHYRRALELLGPAGDEDDKVRRFDLLLALGAAQQRSGSGEFRDSMLQAARLAYGMRDGGRLATAAIMNTSGAQYSRLGGTDDERIEMLERALELAGSHESRERAMLLATLATELMFLPGSHERRRALSDEALAMARSLRSRSTLAQVLLLRITTLWDPPSLVERRNAVAELVELAAQRGDRLLLAAQFHVVIALEAGDAEGAEVALERADRVVREYGWPMLGSLTAARACIAQMRGRFDEAEQMSADAFEAERDYRQDAGLNHASLLFMIRYEQGRLGEMIDALLAFAEQNPGLPVIRSALPLAFVETGRMNEARALLDELAAANFDLPMDPGWGAGVATLAEACARVGDASRAPMLYARMAPFAGQAVSSALYYLGCFDRYLGLLAATQGNLDAARDHFASAAAFEERMRAPGWLARVHLDWGQALLRLGCPDDAAQARDMLERALATARELGMQTVAERASEALALA